MPWVGSEVGAPLVDGDSCKPVLRGLSLERFHVAIGKKKETEKLPACFFHAVQMRCRSVVSCPGAIFCFCTRAPWVVFVQGVFQFVPEVLVCVPSAAGLPGRQQEHNPAAKSLNPAVRGFRTSFPARPVVPVAVAVAAWPRVAGTPGIPSRPPGAAEELV